MRMSRESRLERIDRRRTAWLALAACALYACSAFEGLRIGPSDAGTGSDGPSTGGTGGVGPFNAGTGGVGPFDTGIGDGPSDVGTGGETRTDSSSDGFTVRDSGDAESDDADANVDAGAIEVCNNVDDDADRLVDEGVCVPTQVVGGNDHTCALLDHAQIKCWGDGSSGQLGLGDDSVRGNGLAEMGKNLPVVDLGTRRTAIALAADYRHTCALLDHGQVKCWGYNGSGQLGIGDTVDRGNLQGQMGDYLPPVNLGTGRVAGAIAAGSLHTCALLDSGQVKCWGHGGYGQLGLGDGTSRGGTAASMGDNLPAINLGTGRTATAIDAGGAHTCALLDNGQVKCWGKNDFGQLGLGDTSNRGDNAGEIGDALPAVSLGAGRTAKAIDLGASHTCALLDNGQVKCWGNNGGGQLGLGDTNHRGDNAGEMGDALPPVSLGSERTAIGIQTGASHTCALLDNRQVKCWGANFAGPLGLGDREHRGDNSGEMGDDLPAVDLGIAPPLTAIVAGAFHNCALLGNKVKCWGYNPNGQLGLGDTQNRGDNADEMGDKLPFVSF